MKKRVFIAVACGLGLLGILLSITGFALGGRLGSFTMVDGKLIYHTIGGADKHIFSVPFSDTHFSVSAPGISAVSSSLPVEAPADTLQENQAGALPFKLSELEKIDIDIPFAEITISAGSTLNFSTNNAIPYTSTFEKGTWKLRTNFKGKDVLKEQFSIDITLPEKLNVLEVELEAGRLTLNDIETNKLDCDVEYGKIEAHNIISDKAELSTSAGHISATNFISNDCELSCEAGAIQFEGNVTRYLEADCEMGNINISVPRPESYGWKASADFGTIQIDGSKPSQPQKGDKNTNAPFYDLECEFGKVALVFNS